MTSIANFAQRQKVPDRVQEALDRDAEKSQLVQMTQASKVRVAHTSTIRVPTDGR